MGEEKTILTAEELDELFSDEKKNLINMIGYRFTFLENEIEVLRMLAKDYDDEVRIELAECAYCSMPKEIFGILSKDLESEVRKKVYQNENCPEEVLENLKNEHFDFKIELAEDEYTPDNILDFLAKEDEDEWDSIDDLMTLKVFIVRNPNVSDDTLKELTKDYFVYAIKGSALNVGEEALEKLEKRGFRIENILRELVELNIDSMDDCISQNESTPSDVLDKLSTHFDSYVRENVAKHHNISIDTLINLSQDKDKDVSEVALNHLKKLNFTEDDLLKIK